MPGRRPRDDGGVARLLLAVPVVAALAALLGVAVSDRPTAALVVAAGGGVLVAAALARHTEGRISRLADQVQRFTSGDTAVDFSDGVRSPQWQRLTSGLATMAATLEHRLDDLVEERARVERLLDRLPLAVMLFAADGTQAGESLAYANPAARALFGISDGGGRTPLQVVGVAGLADAVVEAHETGTTVEVEVVREDRELAGRASVTTAGEVVLVVSDLTEARRIEAIRRDFVINASHELKTPVAGIQALSESLALALRRDPERGHRMIERLQSEAARLAQLVRDLLDLARLEESLGGRARQRVDLASVVVEQAERVDPLASERGIDVRVDAPAEAPLVAVPEDLRLIAANLIDNAVQHNRDGGEVRVRVQRRSGDVVLEVADDGVGIPEADQDRIFERFYRVDKGRSRAAGGTGLGLAIVRHAVQRQGGSVSVSSVLGEGSTFRVVLPVEGGSPS